MQREPYLIIEEDNTIGERAPVLYYVMLNNEEYKKINQIVNDFEDTRCPFYYPRMSIHKLKNIDNVI
jgi:hypothetical protein